MSCVSSCVVACCCTSITRILGQEAKGRCIFTHSSLKIRALNNAKSISASFEQLSPVTNGARCRRSLRAILRHGPAQWHTARRRAYFTARTVARHSGDVCDQVPMVPLSGTPRAAEPIYRTHGRLSLRGRLRPGSDG